MYGSLANESNTNTVPSRAQSHCNRRKTGKQQKLVLVGARRTRFGGADCGISAWTSAT